MRIISTIRLYGYRDSDQRVHHETNCGDLTKILWHDGIGLSLYAKRLDRGKFVWPLAKEGVVSISAGQMAYMLEGIDWRNPQLTWRPKSAG
jgi:transposase